MDPPPKRQKVGSPPQNVPLQRTFTDEFLNDSSSTFDGAGISNSNGSIAVGRDVNIISNAAPLPTAANDTRKELLESLRFDQIDARHDSIKKAHYKTCRWFLDTDVYKTWEETGLFHANNFLWIKGKPGVGKSTLMKFLHGQIRARARRKDSNEILISFFFNARGHKLERSTFGLYRSLLWQLLDKRPDLQQVLDELRPGYHWTSESLKSLLEDAIQELGATPIFCLIDALDECDQDEVRDMVSFLEALVDVQSSVHVCLASRHYPHISVQNSLGLILEDHVDHERDIAEYLSSALWIKPKELAEEIRAGMQQKAQGVFIWVVLVVDILNKEYEAGRRHRLRQRLRELPGDLHLLFRDILTRDTNNQAGLLLCIQWVLFAREPLTPRQLYLAILSGTEPEFLPRCHFEPCSEDDVQKYILHESKGLAQSSRSKIPTVQFIHESVRDFLLKGNGPGELFNGPEPNIHGESHEALKNCCLTYLGTQPLVELDKYSRSEVIRTFPFLEYAHSGVLHHANKAGQSGISQEQFLAIFPQAQWVNQHNLMEKSEVRRYTPNVSLLYILAEAGLSELIRAHPSRQSCFEVEGERYGVPILAALASKNEIAVQVMLELEAEQTPGFDFAKFRKRSHMFETALSHTSRSFKYQRTEGLIDQLIKHGDDQTSLFFLETTTQDSWSTGNNPSALLSLACKHARFETAEYLAQYCIDKKVAEGEATPLHYASSHGISEAAALLVNHGADVSATTSDGSTPLHYGAKSDSLQVAKLLVDNGANISVTDRQGSTPLHTAAQYGGFQVAQLLLDQGADISVTDRQGSTPLHTAAQYGGFQVAQLLLDQGADISVTDRQGSTPLHTAAQYGGFQMAQLLLDHGANVVAYDSSKATPLHNACRFGHIEVARLFIDRGAQFSVLDYHRETPLLLALKNGHIEVTQLLIERGAGVSSAANDGDVSSLLAPQEGPDSEVPFHDSAIGTSIGHEGFRKLNPTLDAPLQHLPSVEEMYDTDDDATTFSTATIASTDGKLRYEKNLVMRLCHDLLSSETDKCNVGRISKFLPRMLQVFAFKIAKDKKDEVSQNAKRFIIKHRRSIANHFQTTAQEHLLPMDDRSKDFKETRLTTPWSELHAARMERWEKDSQSGMGPLDDPNRPLDTENGKDKPVDGDEAADGNTNWLSDTENEKEEPADDDEAPEDGMAESIYQSPAYQWLLTKLRKEMVSGVPTQSAIPNLSEAIFKPLKRQRYSRKSTPRRVDVIFNTDWSPHIFLQEQEYGVSPEEAVVKALVLVGTTTRAEGLACGDYLSRQWPDSAPAFIRLVQSVVAQSIVGSAEVTSHIERLDDDTTLQASIEDGRFILQACGHPDSVIEVGEQLMWISCALRSSDFKGAGTIEPRIGKVLIKDRRDDLTADDLSSCISMQIQLVAIPKLDELSESESGACWKTLFRNPLIVEGFPIPYHEDSDSISGLELSLSTLMNLVRDSRLVSFMGKLFIKRFSTLLVAVRQVGNVILWHSISNEYRNYIHYLDKRLDMLDIKVSSSLLKEVNLSEQRHVIGWTSNAVNAAGTSESVSQIEGSNLEHKLVAQIELEKFTVGLSKYITANASMSAGLRDRPLNTPKEGDYEDRIKYISDKFVVLYETPEQRGFLVDGATALLHLVQFSMYRYHEDRGSDAERNPIKVVSDPDLRRRSLRTLWHPENTEMKLSLNLDEDGIKTQTKAISEGLNSTETTHEDPNATNVTREVTESVNKSWKHLRDIVTNIWWMLNPAFDMASNETVKIQLNQICGSEKLKGYEFWKVADSDKAGLLFAPSGRNSPEWLDLVRSLNAVTLFGSGFGDIIRHQNGGGPYMCPDWRSVPKEEGYLAMSNSTLKSIIRFHRNEKTTQLIHEVYENRLQNPFESCIQKDNSQECDRRHFLMKRQEKISSRGKLNLPEHGAVIIGQKRRRTLLECMSGRHAAQSPTRTTRAEDRTSIGQQPSHSSPSIDLYLTTPSSAAEDSSITGNTSLDATTDAQERVPETSSAMRPQHISETSPLSDSIDVEGHMLSRVDMGVERPARPEPVDVATTDIMVTPNENQAPHMVTGLSPHQQNQVGVGTSTSTTEAAGQPPRTGQSLPNVEDGQINSYDQTSRKRKARDTIKSLTKRIRPRE